MALIALLPLLLLAGFAITEAVRAYRANEELRLRDSASLVAAAVNARLGAYVAAMTTLSLAPSLRRDDDHASFHERAVAVGALLGGDILLFGPPPDFELHAISGLPLDAPMPTNPRRHERLILERAASQAAAERRPVISDVFLNYAGQPGIVVLAPVLRGEELLFLVAFRFRPEELLPAMSPASGPGDGFIGLTDGLGRIIVSSRGVEGPPAGTASPARLGGNIEGRQSGITIAPRFDGRSTMFAFERLAQAPGWVIFVGRTREAQLALATTLLSWVLSAMVALAVGVGVLVSAHRREALRLSRQEAAALRTGRAEIERLLGGLPVVIFLRTVKPDGTARLLYRNGDIETVTGWPTALLRDMEDWSAYYLPGWSIDAALLASIQQESTSTDWQMIQPDGGLRSMRTHTRRLSVQPDGSFEVVGYLLNVDAELKAAAQAAAAGRLASLGEMAAGIAHELKQPLQSISLLAENALMTIERGGTDRVAGRLNQIVQQTVHAADIIENLRRFARGTPDGAPPVSVELAHVVRQTLALAEDALRGASVTVRLELGDPSPLVMGHAVGIQQTLLNLLLNARDAMAQQPADMPRSIRIWTELLPEGWVALKVADTGGGIPLPVLARIFEPFVTTKGPDKGTGLGLSISHGLVKAMGGTIEARNVGGGAEFTITLRAAPEDHP